MRGSYLVRRGETFHLRMRVPAPLVGAIGSSEIKLSLYEARRRHAQLKASYLAFHIRGFFAYLHGAMQNLSRAEVNRLVESWRAKMIARDSEVRRLVETGLSSYSLMGYADACDATGDVLADLADKILPTTYDDRDRQPLRGPRLDAAREQALAFATAPVEVDSPECDWQPVIGRDQLSSINEVSKRDLVNAWLPQAARLYYAKAAACADIGYSLSDSLEPEVQSAPLLVVKSPAARPVVQEASIATALSLGAAWQRYVSHQGERKPAWKEALPDSARLAWGDFSALIGEKTPLSTIDRAACKRYEAFANLRPRRALSAYRGLSPQQLEHHDVPSSDRLSKTGINELLGRITTFFKWCLQEHLIDRNPAEGLQAFLLEDGEDGDAGVQAWSMDELQALLSPKNLKDFMDSHKHARGASSSQRWTYFPWLLVLGVYTGARLDEIGGLTVEDVIERHPESEGRTPVFLVRPNEHRGLKTAQARRAIPIHSDLEQMGLWELLRHRKEDVGADLLLWPPRRGDRVAGTHLELLRSDGSYLHVKHFKEIDDDGRICHRDLHIPRPNEAIAETALIDACSKAKDGYLGRSIQLLRNPRIRWRSWQTTPELLIGQAKGLRQKYEKELWGFVERLGSADPFSTKRLIPKARYRMGRLAYLASSEQLLQVADAVDGLPPLRFHAEVMRAISTAHVDRLLPLGTNAAQAAAQPLRTVTDKITLSHNALSGVEIQSLAVFAFNGINANVSSDEFRHDELARFAQEGVSPDLMQSHSPFIAEIACLHGVGAVRHAEVLDSAFDEDEDLAMDAVDQARTSFSL